MIRVAYQDQSLCDGQHEPVLVGNPLVRDHIADDSQVLAVSTGRPKIRGHSMSVSQVCYAPTFWASRGSLPISDAPKVLAEVTQYPRSMHVASQRPSRHATKVHGLPNVVTLRVGGTFSLRLTDKRCTS